MMIILFLPTLTLSTLFQVIDYATVQDTLISVQWSVRKQEDALEASLANLTEKEV